MRSQTVLWFCVLWRRSKRCRPIKQSRR